MRTNCKITKGFTLVELLVVVAIIGILVALLLPVLSRTKAQAQRTVCVNHLRQITLGVRMYADDSRDASPSAGPTGLPLGKMDTLYSGYKALMKSYVGLNGASSPQDKLFACPADVFNLSVLFKDTPHAVHRVKKSAHEDPVFDYSSFTFNGGDNVRRHFAGFSWTTPGLTGVRLSSVKHPERTILLAEIPALFPYSWHAPSSHGLADPSGLMYNDARNEVSFVDGHVSYIKIHYQPPVCAMLTNPPAGYGYQWSPD